MFKITAFWFSITLTALLAWFIYFPKSLMGHMALFVWILTGIVSLYRSWTSDKIKIQYSEKILFLSIGLLSIILSFINQIFELIGISVTFWNSPYSIGEFTVLISGLTVIFFTLLEYRPVLLPASFPIAVLTVYQIVDIFQENIDWIASPLLEPTTALSVFVLNIIGIKAAYTEDFVIDFLTVGGQPISISIVIDCTGIWSLSAFTASAIMIAIFFPKLLSKKGMLFLAIGYVGTYIANIIRVTLICLSAHLYGYSGATMATHVHAGWVAFSIWMFIFWYLTFSRFLLKKENDK